jgi:hypothetical protein
VSNFHVFTSQNTVTKKPHEDQYDSLVVILHGNPTYFLHLSLKKIREASKPCFWFEYPDIYVYDITKALPANAIVNSVENFIKKAPSKSSTPIDIVSSGYTADYLTPKTFHFKLRAPVPDTTKIALPHNFKRVDVANSYFVSSMGAPGLSGAPVFHIYNKVVNNHRINEIIFGGVYSSHISTMNYSVIVKPKELTKLINEKLIATDKIK